MPAVTILFLCIYAAIPHNSFINKIMNTISFWRTSCDYLGWVCKRKWCCLGLQGNSYSTKSTNEANTQDNPQPECPKFSFPPANKINKLRPNAWKDVKYYVHCIMYQYTYSAKRKHKNKVTSVINAAGNTSIKNLNRW